MQHRKCCYCEKELNPEDTQCETEHYMPKSALKDVNGDIQWHLANKWENLLKACRDCNSAKGVQLPINNVTGLYEIIDPTNRDIDPEDHIDFDVVDSCFICLKGKNGSQIGQSTIEKLKLTVRRDLRAKYSNAIVEIESTFQKLTKALIDEDPNELSHQINQLLRSMSADVPYAAFSRNFIAKRLRILNEVHIPQLEHNWGGLYERITINFPVGHEIRG